MTHPSENEVQQDTEEIKSSLWKCICSWEFVIAIFATVIIYKIIDMVVLYLRVKIGK